MKPGDAYRRAALWLHKQPLCMRGGMCLALSKNSGPYPDDGFDDLFRPRRTRSAWWGEQWSADLAERRNCRIIALLLAAAMADAGDL